MRRTPVYTLFKRLDKQLEQTEVVFQIGCVKKEWCPVITSLYFSFLCYNYFFLVPLYMCVKRNETEVTLLTLWLGDNSTSKKLVANKRNPKHIADSVSVLFLKAVLFIHCECFWIKTMRLIVLNLSTFFLFFKIVGWFCWPRVRGRVLRMSSYLLCCISLTSVINFSGVLQWRNKDRSKAAPLQTKVWRMVCMIRYFAMEGIEHPRVHGTEQGEPSWLLLVWWRKKSRIQLSICRTFHT